MRQRLGLIRRERVGPGEVALQQLDLRIDLSRGLLQESLMVRLGGYDERAPPQHRR